MNRYTPKEYLEMCQQHIEDVVSDKCQPRYIAARIKSAGSFENLLLSLIEDEKYFKLKVEEAK